MCALEQRAAGARRGLGRGLGRGRGPGALLAGCCFVWLALVAHTASYRRQATDSSTARFPTSPFSTSAFSTPGSTYSTSRSSTSSSTEDTSSGQMDVVPQGFLPDSVYKEIAWYGISQVQPLPNSAKNKMVAREIWRHTLNRPHVILESPPQVQRTPPRVSRRIIAEEGAKWSRDQRTKQEILMDIIRNGGNGNGLTIRSVVGAASTTTFIIINGALYQCPGDSEPDVEFYQSKQQFHEPRCTFDKGPEPVEGSVDPCVEGESTPLEFSPGPDGGEWVFCLGVGERDQLRLPNHTVDCGHKTKVTLKSFLSMCAIDNNVVIDYKYFGDESRKDILKNVTICESGWNPCHLSYLYRLEMPADEEAPVFPASTPHPCAVMPCPECLDTNDTHPDGVLIDTEEGGKDTRRAHRKPH